MRKFRQHQLDAIRFAVTREQSILGMPHAYIAHDVGTGKTITAIGILKEIDARSALIICPPKIKDQNIGSWAHRMVEWGLCEPEQIGVIRSQTFDSVEWCKPYILCGWQMACKTVPLTYLREKQFDACVLDEARALKSLTSDTSRKILGSGRGNPLIASGRFKFLLDGTPVPNRPIELFPPAKVLAEPLLGRFKDYHAFSQYFCVNPGANPDDGYTGANHMDELGEILSEFMHRVSIDDVCDLPGISFEDVFIDIGGMEEDKTNTVEAKLRRLVGMQKVPFAVEFIKEKLKSLAYDHRKLLVFTHHRDVNKELCNRLNGISIIGGMNDTDRENAITRFKHGPQDIPLIASLRAFGDATDGIQGYCADIVQVEVDWSNGQNNQGYGRVKRDGQTRFMNVSRLIALGTRDEDVLGSHNAKGRKIAKLFGSITTKGKASMFEEFMSLFGRLVVAVEAIAGSEGAAAETPKSDAKPGKPPAGKPAAAAASAAKSGGKVWSLDDARARNTKLGKVMEDETAAVTIIRECLKTLKIAPIKGEAHPKTSQLPPDKIENYCELMDKEIERIESEAAASAGSVNDA